MDSEDLLKESQRILSEAEEKELKEIMKTYNSNDVPQIGLFWYNPEKKKLVGVYKDRYDIVWEQQKKKGSKYPIVSYPVLHKDLWHEVVASKQLPSGDYTEIPRGRIWFYPETFEFKIMIGKWIEDYPEAKNLIIKEMNLEKVNPVFAYGKHWDLGSGWSGDLG
jgi:hypothetical protein